DDVLSIHRVGGLSPLTLLLHRKAGEHPPHRRDLCLPPISIRHFHTRTTLHNQLTQRPACSTSLRTRSSGRCVSSAHGERRCECVAAAVHSPLLSGLRSDCWQIMVPIG